MRKVFIFFLIPLAIFLISGCDKAKTELLGKGASKKGQKVSKVESVELAEAILWPEPYQFKFTRDPFKPLVGEKSLSGQQDLEAVSLPYTDIRVFGILKMDGGGSIVLLELPSGVGLIREGDRVGKYTVKQITADSVILEGEGKSRILEIGGEE